jgi:hypothetical protein
MKKEGKAFPSLQPLNPQNSGFNGLRYPFNGGSAPVTPPICLIMRTAESRLTVLRNIVSLIQQIAVIYFLAIFLFIARINLNVAAAKSRGKFYFP